jgi:hypothetical protein
MEAMESFFFTAPGMAKLRGDVEPTKLTITGGFRTAQGMADAIPSGEVDLIRLSRPLSPYPDAPAALLKGALSSLAAGENELQVGPGLLELHSCIKLIRAISGLGSMTWINAQLIRVSQGLPPDSKMSFTRALPGQVQTTRKTANVASSVWQPLEKQSMELKRNWTRSSALLEHCGSQVAVAFRRP